MKKQSESISLSGGDVLSCLMMSLTLWWTILGPKSLIVAKVEKLRVHNALRSVEGEHQQLLSADRLRLMLSMSRPIFSVLPAFCTCDLIRIAVTPFNQFSISLPRKQRNRASHPKPWSVVFMRHFLSMAVRAYASSCIAPHGGMLAAISDKYLGEVVKAMHASMKGKTGH